MIQQIFSATDQNTLLVSILDAGTVSGRVDGSGHEEILQVSAIALSAGREIRPHEHLPAQRNTVGTQEAWVVISGSLLVEVFDLDQSLIYSGCLTPGQCMVLYRGGHRFTVQEDHTVIYEIKNGPYRGPESDSKVISS